MRAQVKNSKNVGSKTTSSENRVAAVASTGSSRTLRVRGRRPSAEGYQSAPSAHIMFRTSGYMNPDVQTKRYADKSLSVGPTPGVGSLSSNFKNPTAMSNIGRISTGSAKVLGERMELNEI